MIFLSMQTLQYECHRATVKKNDSVCTTECRHMLGNVKQRWHGQNEIPSNYLVVRALPWLHRKKYWRAMRKQNVEGMIPASTRPHSHHCPQHYGPPPGVTRHTMAPASFRHCPGPILPLPWTIMGAALPHPSIPAWPRGAPTAQQQPHISVWLTLFWLAPEQPTSKSYNWVAHQNDRYLSTVWWS